MNARISRWSRIFRPARYGLALSLGLGIVAGPLSAADQPQQAGQKIQLKPGSPAPLPQTAEATPDLGGKAAADNPAKPAAQAEPRVQLAILLDTSSSMDGLINQARTQLWKIVNQFATAKQDGKDPRLEVALYEYGNDRLPASEGYIRQVLGFTDDLDKVSEELFKLSTNGGNEFCGQVIDVAAKQLTWSKANSDLKCIFIAGNEPFTQGPVEYKKACQTAINAGITINTIHCGPEQVGVNTGWKDGAALADGSFVCIDQNQVVETIAAPQDKELAELSGKLNTTYLAYGKKEKQLEFAQRQAAQDANAAKSAPSAAAARAQFKSSGLYSNSAYDLIDALRDKKVKLEEVKEDELPEELKKLKPEERKAYLEKKEQERVAIQAKIKELSEARNAYIAEQRKQNAGRADGTLDTAIIRVTREQAEKKNFKFESPEVPTAPKQK